MVHSADFNLAWSRLFCTVSYFKYINRIYEIRSMTALTAVAGSGCARLIHFKMSARTTEHCTSIINKFNKHSK